MFLCNWKLQILAATEDDCFSFSQRFVYFRIGLFMRSCAVLSLHQFSSSEVCFPTLPDSNPASSQCWELCCFSGLLFLPRCPFWAVVLYLSEVTTQSSTRSPWLVLVAAQHVLWPSLMMLLRVRGWEEAPSLSSMVTPASDFSVRWHHQSCKEQASLMVPKLPKCMLFSKSVLCWCF